MARFLSNYSHYVEEQTELGHVTTLSHVESMEIDMTISGAFFKARKDAELKQRNSVRLLRQLNKFK